MSGQQSGTGFTAEQKKFIRTEITSQLNAMSTQLLAQLRSELALSQQELKQQCDQAKQQCDQVKQQNDAVTRQCANVTKQLNDVNGQLTVSNDRQIAALKRSTQELAVAVTKKVSAVVSAQVYDKVIGELNTSIVPQVNQVVNWMAYSTQDGQGVVDDFRRNTMSQFTADPGTRLLTNGGNTSHIISDHVRVCFTDDD